MNTLKILRCFDVGSGSNKIFCDFLDNAVGKYREECREKPEEAVALESADKTDESTPLLLVGTPRKLMKDGLGNGRCPCVVILPDNQWDGALQDLLQHPDADVVLVVRGKPRPREEDVMQLAEILKHLVRRRLRAVHGEPEEHFVKEVDWKCKISDGDMTDSSFVSFFSDPAMHRMGRALKAALAAIRNKVKQKVPKVHSILLLGETGTGKSLAAQWIARQLFPDEKKGTPSLFPLNVSSLPANMVDAELFGAVKGAYTSCDADRDGILSAPKSGGCYKEQVVFLDEIGEMQPESQVRLLRYLDSGEVRPVGSTRVSNVYSVLVGATNRPLERWIGRDDSPFRADLFHRFDYVVRIPSLAERKKDLRLLISLLLQDQQVNPHVDGERGVEKISLDAIEYLEDATYPGNFRDLRYVVRAAVSRATAEGAGVLCLRHLAVRF